MLVSARVTCALMARYVHLPIPTPALLPKASHRKLTCETGYRKSTQRRSSARYVAPFPMPSSVAPRLACRSALVINCPFDGQICWTCCFKHTTDNPTNPPGENMMPGGSFSSSPDNPMDAAGARHNNESPGGMRTTDQPMSQDQGYERCLPLCFESAPATCIGDGVSPCLDSYSSPWVNRKHHTGRKLTWCWEIVPQGALQGKLGHF